jgi:hypothetical protein
VRGQRERLEVMRRTDGDMDGMRQKSWSLESEQIQISRLLVHVLGKGMNVRVLS